VTLARLTTTGVAFLPLVLASGAARADDDIAALRGRLDQIKELVVEFETRLNALEAARGSAAVSPPQAGAAAVAATGPVAAPEPAPIAPPSSVTPPTAAEAPVVVPRAQWRRVQTGLTMEEVKALIGAPTKTFELAGKRVWYYYYPGIGAGSVFFDTNARASSFQRPAGGN